VDASIAGQHARGTVFLAPRELPYLSEAGVLQPRTVVQTLETLLAYGPHGTAVNTPTGMVVDLRILARGPDKDLQREGTITIFVLAGHVPVGPPVPLLLQKWKNLELEKRGILDEPGHVEGGPPHSVLRGNPGEVLQIVHEAWTSL
jgi:hypothetical protein